MEFDPAFTFDANASEDDDAHPWEFSGALAQAHKPHPGQTSVNEKIQARLVPSKASKENKKRGRQNIEEETSSEDLDDEPLPGELDSDSESMDSSGAEAASADEASEDGSDDPVFNNEGDTDGSEDENLAAEDGESMNSSEDTSASEESEDGGVVTVESGDEDEPMQRHTAGDGSESDNESDEERANSARRASNGHASSTGGRFFADTPDDTRFAAKTFAELNLSRPLVKACTVLGYSQPTPIQAACIPLALMGRDIVGSAITGSGKTAAFSLPLLERLLFRQKRVVATYVLVLTPVRELAVQVHSMISKLAQFTDIRAALVVGGLSIQKQAAELRKGPEIVVATPGRMIDHVMNTMAFELDSLSALVLDEADRLLEMGFMEEIKQIVKLAPRKRQTLLFSATMTDEVQKLITLSLSSPVRLAADAKAAAPSRLRQEIVRFKGAAANDKDAALMSLCARTLKDSRTIIFCSQKFKVHRLRILMGLAELPLAAELHGDMTQAARLEALEQFRKGQAHFLLATDVAARGLDILGVQTVINYDCPKSLDAYLHRIGRTARAGKDGLAITFVEDTDRGVIKDVVKKVKVTLSNRVLPAPTVAGWRVRVERLYGKVQDVVQEEREEKILRKAEMEATKAANMIEHESEIYGRPKREWFMSEKQKKDLAAASKGDKEQREADEAAGRKGKAAKAARNAEMKGAKETKRAPPKHVADTEQLMGRVKAAKSAARHLRETGTRPTEASKAALTAVGAKKSEKQKKKKRKLDDKRDDLDDGEPKRPRIPADTRVYAGGGKSGKVKTTASGLSKAQKARISRGGKGAKQFKGKARFKRRK